MLTGKLRKLCVAAAVGVVVVFVFCSHKLQRPPGTGDGTIFASERDKTTQTLQHSLKETVQEIQQLREALSHARPAPDNVQGTVKQDVQQPCPPSFQCSNNTARPSRQQEAARRHLDSSAATLSHYVNSWLRNLKMAVSGNSTLQNLIGRMDRGLQEHDAGLMSDLRVLRHVDKGETWRLAESFRLGRLVQRRLDFLQNPQNCSQTKFILCTAVKGCGYGCQLHHAAYCLIVAYGTGRTLVLSSSDLPYRTGQGWETVFLPLSRTCKHTSGHVVMWGDNRTDWMSAQTIRLPLSRYINPRPEFLPMAIPEDLAQRLSAFHGDPALWWIGHFLRYLTRPNKQMRVYWEKKKKEMGFQKPIVGVQIRRTDKLSAHEAKFYSLEEYMGHVTNYFLQRQRHQAVRERRVFLATDDPSVLAEARLKYPGYVFISDYNTTQAASLQTRFTNTSLVGIVTDVHLLSQTDYLVCTFSSNVCRAAYELMQTFHGDFTREVRSLDYQTFFFAGQLSYKRRSADDILAIEMPTYPEVLEPT